MILAEISEGRMTDAGLELAAPADMLVSVVRPFSDSKKMSVKESS